MKSTYWTRMLPLVGAAAIEDKIAVQEGEGTDRDAVHTLKDRLEVLQFSMYDTTLPSRAQAGQSKADHLNA